MRCRASRAACALKPSALSFTRLRPDGLITTHVTMRVFSCQHYPDERRRARQMRQYDNTDSSTRFCDCGKSFTWSGVDPELDAWMKEHEPHCVKAQHVSEVVDQSRSEDQFFYQSRSEDQFFWSPDVGQAVQRGDFMYTQYGEVIPSNAWVRMMPTAAHCIIENYADWSEARRLEAREAHAAQAQAWEAKEAARVAQRDVLVEQARAKLTAEEFNAVYGKGCEDGRD